MSGFEGDFAGCSQSRPGDLEERPRFRYKTGHTVIPDRLTAGQQTLNL